jgi:hypothetical protein
MNKITNAFKTVLEQACSIDPHLRLAAPISDLIIAEDDTRGSHLITNNNGYPTPLGLLNSVLKLLTSDRVTTITDNPIKGVTGIGVIEATDNDYAVIDGFVVSNSEEDAYITKAGEVRWPEYYERSQRTNMDRAGYEAAIERLSHVGIAHLGYEDRIAAQRIYAEFGIIGEVGEVNEEIKKAVFYGKPCRRLNLVKEAGDILWYVTLLPEARLDASSISAFLKEKAPHADLLWAALQRVIVVAGVTLGQILAVNLQKLQERYPVRYTPQEAVAQNDEAK